MTRSTSKQSLVSRNNIGLWLVGGSVLIVALIVVLIVISNNRALQVDVEAYNDIPIEWIQDNSLGDPAAPVVVSAFEDFLCSHCQNWTRTIEPRLVEEYVKTGKARLVYQYFPVFGTPAQLGAVAAACAANQGAFWPYHDLLFQVAGTQGQAGFDLNNFVDYANSLNLDSRQFTQCMSTQETLPVVQESIQLGVSKGVNATPTLMVNGEIFANSMDFDGLGAEIDRLYTAATGGQ